MRRQPPEEDRDLSHSWKGHGTYSSFEKEFQRMFQEFENIFRGTFSERPSIEYKFPDFNGTSEEEESKFFNIQFVDNTAEGRISKRVFQENKARQIFRKTNVCVSGSKKVFGKFGMLCFLKTPVLRFVLSALLPTIQNFHPY